jgi:glyoxylase-like metal-dependent hydrolase (beta-lactamase superfamily II)
MGIDALAQRVGCPVAVNRRAFDAFHGGPPLRRPPGRSAWPLAYGWAIQGFPVLPADDWRVVRRYLDPEGPNPFASDLVALDDGRPLPGLPGWKVLSTPGHSDDAMALFHARAGFLVTGDTIRNFFGGEWNPVQTDPEAFRLTRALLGALPVRAIFPGHGPVLEGRDVVKRLAVVGGRGR